jgi:addiction module RelE/StbE family toxin
MKIFFSQEFEKKIKKITKKDKRLLDKLESLLIIFQKNIFHPSLRLHKLEGKQNNCWSISVNRKIRIILKIEGDVAYFIDIGNHDEVYD